MSSAASSPEIPTDRSLAIIYFPAATAHARVKHLTRIRDAARQAGLPAPLHIPREMPAWFAAMQTRGYYPRGCPEAFRTAAAHYTGPITHETLAALSTSRSAPVTAPSHDPPPPSPAPAPAPPAPSPPASSSSSENPTPTPIPAPSPVPAPPPPKTQSKPQSQSPPPPPLNATPEDILHRLQATEAGIHQQILTARTQDPPDQTLIAHITAQHQKSVAALTAYRTHLEKTGHLIPIADATAAYRRIITPMPALLRDALIAHPPDPQIPWPQQVTTIVQHAFQHIRDQLPIAHPTALSA